MELLLSLTHPLYRDSVMGIRLQLVKYPVILWIFLPELDQRLKYIYIYSSIYGTITNFTLKSLWMIKLSIINYIIHLMLATNIYWTVTKARVHVRPGTASSNETDIAQIYMIYSPLNEKDNGMRQGCTIRKGQIMQDLKTMLKILNIFLKLM